MFTVSTSWSGLRYQLIWQVVTDKFLQCMFLCILYIQFTYWENRECTRRGEKKKFALVVWWMDLFSHVFILMDDRTAICCFCCLQPMWHEMCKVRMPVGKSNNTDYCSNTMKSNNNKKKTKKIKFIKTTFIFDSCKLLLLSHPSERKNTHYSQWMQ